MTHLCALLKAEVLDVKAGVTGSPLPVVSATTIAAMATSPVTAALPVTKEHCSDTVVGSSISSSSSSCGTDSNGSSGSSRGDQRLEAAASCEQHQRVGAKRSFASLMAASPF